MEVRYNMSNKITVKPGFFWTYYEREGYTLDSIKAGGWIWYFKRIIDAKKKCQDTVELELAGASKHSNSDDGVAIFSLNIDDIEGHIKLIEYMIENDMIEYEHDNVYRDISFVVSLSSTTPMLQHSIPQMLKLSSFVNLETHEIDKDKLEAQVQRWFITMKQLGFHFNT